MHLKLGTRRSKLAQIQTDLVIQTLSNAFPDATFEKVLIDTQGDRCVSSPLYQMKNTGVFVKDIEKALLQHEIDIAVHSLKDVSSTMDDSLTLLPHFLFEDKRDALITKEHCSLMSLKPHAIIATSSLRRMACIKHVRPDIEFVNIRGNIDTRIQKFMDSSIDGIVLSAAGLKRSGLTALIDEYLDPSQIIPACGQGTLALQIRKEDLSLYTPILPKTNLQRLEVDLERAFLKESQAGCHYPIGCFCQIDDQMIHIDACIGDTIEQCIFLHESYTLDQYDQVISMLYKKIKETCL